MFPRDMVLPAILDKVRTGLVEAERDTCPDALPVEVEHPFKLQWTGVFARFTTHRDLLDQIRVEIA